MTIVHGDKKLLNDAYADRFRDAAAKNIETRKVNLVLGDHLDSFDIVDKSVVTRNGKKIVADLVVCTSSLTGPTNTDDHA